MNNTSPNASLNKEDSLRREFAQLVEQYSQRLYWTIRRIVLNHEDADDVLQNVFVKAWQNIDGFEHRSNISTWLYRIAVNEALDFLRRQRLAFSIEEELGVTLSSRLMADDYFDGDAAQALLQEAIATLPDVQRVVFNLRYFDEMPYSEMSRMLGTSEGALKASYHIAVKKITTYLRLHQ